MLMIDALPPPQPQIEYVVMQDVRTVHDTATLQLSDYGTIENPSWALIVITPGSDSGSATVPGGYIEAKTGTLVIPDEAGVVVVKKGKWQLCTSADPTHPTSGTYTWTEPITWHKRILEPEDFYSPLIQGGTLLFQPNPAGKGINQFQHPRVIFSQWKDMVQPAFAYSMQVGYVVNGRATDGDVRMLTDLMSQPNALLSILALRELLRLRSVTPQSTRGLFHGKDDRLKAVSAFLMLTASSVDERDDWLNQIIQLVKESSNPEDIYPLGLSVFTAVLFRSRDAEIVASGKTVLSTIKRRLETLQIPVEKAPRLYFILSRSEVD